MKSIFVCRYKPQSKSAIGISLSPLTGWLEHPVEPAACVTLVDPVCARSFVHSGDAQPEPHISGASRAFFRCHRACAWCVVRSGHWPPFDALSGDCPLDNDCAKGGPEAASRSFTLAVHSELGTKLGPNIGALILFSLLGKADVGMSEGIVLTTVR
jgi:hypothetical protein